MTKRDWITLAVIVGFGYTNQRDLVSRTGYSLGLVNASLHALMDAGYLDAQYMPTRKTGAYIEASRPRRAVILAAGAGLRMMPISRVPKGLLEVNDEPLIARIIGQLHEANVTDIAVVTGYMMEKFEYLTDKFGAELIYNPDFAARDTLHSLACAADRLDNAYVVPSNIWFARNPFSRTEYFSWYAVSGFVEDESFVRVNRKMELVLTDEEHGGNAMLGLAYLLAEDAGKLRANVEALDKKRSNLKAVWETALLNDDGKMIPYARVMQGQSAYEIKTYEQLRELDGASKNLASRRIAVVSRVFHVEPGAITGISPLFRGMTNRLMRFCVDGRQYLFRVPGEGSDKLTDRRQEADVYAVLKGSGLAENVVYIDPAMGYKISEYRAHAHTCDPKNWDEVKLCLAHLKKLHASGLSVAHTFDPFEKLAYYESLRGEQSVFPDYAQVSRRVTSLKALVAALPRTRCLCHVDAVCDNFLIEDGQVCLIDWEYAGMSDPYVDVAMFCLYAQMNRDEADRAAALYAGGTPDPATRCKFYAYLSVCGLLWTVWSEYKRQVGVDYGEYAVTQYRFAKRYHARALEAAQKLPDASARLSAPVEARP